MLDNNSLKNSPNFKRLHLLFYENLFCCIDLDVISSKVLLKVKELYNNNFYKYDEEIKREYKENLKYTKDFNS